jgi:excisionase family DNA binding protein
MEKLMKANEIANILGVSRSAVFNLWRRGELPAVRIGKSVRCRPSDLETFIANNSSDPTKNLLAVRATNRSEQVAHTSNGDTYA